MSFIPKPHEIYKHFKGNLYQVTAIAEHTETGEQLVVYQALYGDFLTYARPLAMFVGRVDREKYPDAVQEFRFELQGPEAGRQRAESQGVPEESNSASQAFFIHGGASAASASGVEPMAVKQESRIETAVPGEPVSDIGSAADQKSGAQDGEEENSIDPLVLEFLDADSYGEQLNILAALHHRITDDMITTMAVACDIEINEGDLEERYEALKTCLLTLERYECNRLR